MYFYSWFLLLFLPMSLLPFLYRYMEGETIINCFDFDFDYQAMLVQKLRKTFLSFRPVVLHFTAVFDKLT